MIALSRGPTQADLFGWTKSLPLEGDEVELLIYDNRSSGPMKLAGTVRVPNPFAKVAQSSGLVAAPLPITNRSDAATIVLQSAMLGGDQGWRDSDGRVPTHPVARFEFAIASSEATGVGDWVPLGFHGIDAQQSFWQVWNDRKARPLRTGKYVTMAEWQLWPGRQAVRIETYWVTSSGGLSETVWLREVPMPNASSVSGSTLVGAGRSRSQRGAGPLPAQRLGYGVGLGPVIYWTNLPVGNLCLSEAANSSAGSLEMRIVGVHVEASYATNGWCASILNATDEHGRRLTQLGNLSKAVVVPLTSKRLNLEIGLAPVHRADFVIRPDLLVTNQPIR